MNMNEIELKIYGMSSTIHPAEAYALVLEEVNGERKLPIIIGQTEAQSIKVTMMQYDMPRPLTHDLMCSLMQTFGAYLEKIVIYKVKDGVFYSYLYIVKDGVTHEIDARTSDAIALALRCKSPIYTLSHIMDNEQMRDMGDGSFALSVNMVSIDILRDALDKAVESENFEQASKLRDEIRRREEEDKTK